MSLTKNATRSSLAPTLIQNLCAARLIPLRKKDDGVRPIAVGETLRRIIAKWMAKSGPGTSLAKKLAPLQVAFAKGGPCEVTAMAVSELAKNNAGTPKYGAPPTGHVQRVQHDLARSGAGRAYNVRTRLATVGAGHISTSPVVLRGHDTMVNRGRTTG